MSLDNYYESSSGVWTRDEQDAFNYSDGDEVENRLLKNVSEAKDVSLASDDLQRLMIDWPSEYHFSPLRSNLLSSFDFSKCNNILEIGSGCGAVTRLLGEQCPTSKILALEGSVRRAEITRARCKDLSNVEVYSDSFTNFEPGQKFELITLIGVLEYSPSFFDSEKPILEALNRARSLLTSDGVLVIAIENQLGLKYFNGCSEDHNGQPFFGINDQYEDGTFRTFGKKQLQDKIAEAGFKSAEFVYPFPDYKLPQLLLREEAFGCNQLDISNLLGQYPARDYGGAIDRVFQESRAWDVISRNGLVRDMANSFLVFASAGENSLEDITEPWLIKAFSGRRKKKYLIETEFLIENEKILVNKKTSYAVKNKSDISESKQIVHHVGLSEYVKGIPYCCTLLKTVCREDAFRNFISYLTPWINWLRDKSFNLPTTGGHTKIMVPGELYDCMPANFLISRQNELTIIDQEWEYTEPLELGFVLFRGLYRELSANIEFFEQSDMFAGDSIEDLFNKIFSSFDLAFNREIFDSYLDLETNVQLELVPYSTEKKGLISNIKLFVEQKRMSKPRLSDLFISGGVGSFDSVTHHLADQIQIIADRDEQILNMNQAIAERDNMLETVFRSRSWQLTLPLRMLGYLAKGDFDKFGIVVKKVKTAIGNIPTKLGIYRQKFKQKFIRIESSANSLAIEEIIASRCSETFGTGESDAMSVPIAENLPDVDISVVTYNSQKWITGFIESVVLLKYPKSNLTITFVDNGSSDSTVDILNSESLKLTKLGVAVNVISQKNNGFGAGHNVGIQKGSAQFCLVTNVDITFDQNALGYIVSTALVDTANVAAWELRQKPYEHPKFYDPVTGQTNWNSHACILLRRSHFENAGGYDETLFMYGEDVELSYRFRGLGYLLRYCPRASVNHYCYEHADQIKPLQHSGSTFANLYLRLKYGTTDDILAIPYLSGKLLFAPQPYKGARLAAVRNIFRIAFLSPRVLWERKKATKDVVFPFYGWGYELVRDGAFSKQDELLNDLPLVTIITRTYKGRELYLRQALLSVAHQSYPNIEHIVIEDGGNSLRHLVEDIGRYCSRPAKYIGVEKHGRSVAGNVGLSNATGHWCMFLDDDDLLFGDHVELLVSVLFSNSDAVAAYSLAWEVPTDDSMLGEGQYREKQYIVPDILKGQYDYEKLQHHNLMAIQSILFERKLFEQRGGFDSDLDILEDWVLWACYGFDNKFIHVPKVSSMYRIPFDQNVKDVRQEAIDAGYNEAVERAKIRIGNLGVGRLGGF